MDQSQKDVVTVQTNFITIFNNTFMTDKAILAKFKHNDEKEPEITDTEWNICIGVKKGTSILL